MCTRIESAGEYEASLIVPRGTAIRSSLRRTRSIHPSPPQPPQRQQQNRHSRVRAAALESHTHAHTYVYIHTCVYINYASKTGERPLVEVRYATRGRPRYRHPLLGAGEELPELVRNNCPPVAATRSCALDQPLCTRVTQSCPPPPPRRSSRRASVTRVPEARVEEARDDARARARATSWPRLRERGEASFSVREI